MLHWKYFFLSLVFACCQSVPPHPGVALAETHCSSCHLNPSPALLTKEIWKDAVLPQMGARLGMKTSFAELRNARQIGPTGLAPSTPLMSEQEWLMLKNYFSTSAPDSLIIDKNYPITQDLPAIFTMRDLQLPTSAKSASMVKIDTLANALWYGSGQTERLYRYRWLDHKVDSIDIGGAPAQVIVQNDKYFLLSMGLIHPNDRHEGTILQFNPSSMKLTQKLLTGLPRPVQFVVDDLDQDGEDDFLVCGFGYLLGHLSWFRNDTNSFTAHQLDPLPGAIVTRYEDFDGDEMKDIIVLMAQGDEGIYYYKNLGNGQFGPKTTILQFPPSYGSTFFELKDFNGDHRKDILYVNGDNGDYRPLLKPYHGVRIFHQIGDLNDPKFEETVFLQVNGAFKAIAEDFDQDGDIDIACISYFPDVVNTPEEGFVYFDNIDGAYTGYLTPIGAQGKWLVMDAGDFDRDGDLDLVIGSSNTMTAGLNDQQRANLKGMAILENRTISTTMPLE